MGVQNFMCVHVVLGSFHCERPFANFLKQRTYLLNLLILFLILHHSLVELFLPYCWIPNYRDQWVLLLTSNQIAKP
jgi:hypothetical protein